MKKVEKILKQMRILEKQIDTDQKILKLLQYTEPYDEIKDRIRSNMVEHFKLGQVLMKRDLRHGNFMIIIGIAIIGLLTYVSVHSYITSHYIIAAIDLGLAILNIFTTLRLSKSQKSISDMYNNINKLIKEHEDKKSLQNSENII